MTSKHLLLILLTSTYVNITTSGYNYIKTGVNMTGKQSLVFQIQSTQAALLALVSTPGDVYHNMHEIAFDIGPKTAVRTSTGTNNVATCVQPTVLLNGVVPVWLWISWANGMIMVGKGNAIGKNVIIFYPDNSLLANLSTVQVSSFGAVTGEWRIPYNETGDVAYYSPMQDIIDNELTYDPTVCQDVVFTAPSGTVKCFDLKAIFVGRTTFKFQVDTYSSFSNISLCTQQNCYMFRYLPPGMNIFKDGVSVGYYLIVNSKPPINESPGYYWISWQSGVFIVGFGQDLGKGTLLFYTDTQSIDIRNGTACFSGKMTLSFLYYVGVTGLQRKRGDEYNMMNFKKFGSDLCASGAVIQSIPAQICSELWCSLWCIENKQCTAFCVRKPSSLNGTSCTCEFQAKPGTPSSPYLYQYEPGSSYWEMSV